MTPLFWFPFNVQTWEQLSRGLSNEEKGALVSLLARAWVDELPGTIPDTSDELARVLGARWKRYLPLVDRHFPVVDGRRRCAWLVELYADQAGKRERRAKAGRENQAQRNTRAGGRPPRTSNGKTSNKTTNETTITSSETGNGSSPLAQDLSGGTTTPFGSVVVPPAPDGARATLTGSRAVGAAGAETSPPPPPPPQGDRRSADGLTPAGATLTELFRAALVDGRAADEPREAGTKPEARSQTVSHNARC